MKDSFLEKTALIVGGTGGIGREISLALSKTGANLVIHGSRKSEKTDILASEIEKNCKKKPEIAILNLFETDFDDLESSELLKYAKKTDILCVCFGPFVQQPLHETNLSDWKKVALFDYAFPGLLISAALPNMMKNHFGRILLFGGTGTSFRSDFRTNAAYAGAKLGLNAIVSSVASNYARFGITCNAICPGFVETEYLSEEQKSDLKEKMPLGNLISTKSVAEKAVFLLENPEINGDILRLDAGWST